MSSFGEIIVTMRSRVDCVICGRESFLGATCSRCGKQSCHREQCIRLINEPGQCKAPPKGERNDNTGDKRAARKRLG